MSANKPIGSTYCTEHLTNVKAGGECARCARAREVLEHLAHSQASNAELNLRLVQVGNQLVETAAWGKRLHDGLDDVLLWMNEAPGCPDCGIEDGDHEVECRALRIEAVLHKARPSK